MEGNCAVAMGEIEAEEDLSQKVRLACVFGQLWMGFLAVTGREAVFSLLDLMCVRGVGLHCGG